MKLRQTTWILLVSTFLLGGVVYFTTTQETTQQQELTNKQQKLFNFVREDIQDILIKTPKTTLQFEATNNQVTPWRMKQPEQTLASNATVSFLVDLLINGKSEKTFTIPVEQKKEYGLDIPQAIITITLKNQKTHQLILGKTDFEDKFLYAQIDPINSEVVQISLVDKSFQFALERELSEWKQEP
ncbi:hypothetical protein C7H19_01135 [Aphanothece hegewaldii CCALA 016]|uniref:DUF4340 domain-containing protein n=1 Tax=Aphanothece hegewaldii CCALA 016 TaxID=2107694 RepID=A0A2T1M3M7_9CHRO|nr:DUF4340 domain-containing protein [Aphanothece hegewaldii]PSF39422.1 hypothetical protein C7H19_01135 [Aphanothece hegewaldii CCALA 016]